MTPVLNPALTPNEVPDLREAVGWARRDPDYPEVLSRCLYFAGCRDDRGLLIAFGMMIGAGFEHAYLEDVMVHPGRRRRGVGGALVRCLINEARRRETPIVTITHAAQHADFYGRLGFMPCPGGLWTQAKAPSGSVW